MRWFLRPYSSPSVVMQQKRSCILSSPSSILIFVHSMTDSLCVFRVTTRSKGHLSKTVSGGDIVRLSLTSCTVPAGRKGILQIPEI